MAPPRDPWVPDCEVGSYADYDREVSFDTYRRWHLYDPDVTDDDVMRHLKRYIVMVANARYYTYDIERRAEFVQTAVFWTWRDYVRRRRFPIDRGVAVFHGWVSWIVARARCVLPRDKRLLKGFESNDLMDHAVRRVPTAEMAELKIFLEDLPKALYHRCLYRASGRYKSPRLAGALRYVLNRVFKQEPICEAWLRKHYGVSDHRLFVDYTRMIIRSELSRMAEEIDVVTPSRRRDMVPV